MCDEGYDAQFHKKHGTCIRSQVRGGYLVGKYYIAAYGTVGGVRINKYGEVMDADLKPIPGLYSAGSDANTIYGDSYNFTLCGNTMGFAITPDVWLVRQSQTTSTRTSKFLLKMHKCA